MTAPTGSATAQQIYIIRHAEKPPDASPSSAPGADPGPPYGVDLEGQQDEHSLIPQGWQRAGALAALFDPAVGDPRPGITPPNAIFAPCYKSDRRTQKERTYETVLPLSLRRGIATETLYETTDVTDMARVAIGSTGVVLVCWEHDNIPLLASSIPTIPGTVIPEKWPGERFDIIWSFTLSDGASSPQYDFSQIPQLLLAGDKPIESQR